MRSLKTMQVIQNIKNLNSIKSTNFIKKQILLFLIGILFLSNAYAEQAGKVLFVYGKAQIQRGTQVIHAKKGSIVEAGDFVRTNNASTVQIKLTDGTLIALRPNTIWNLKEYLYNKANPSLNKQGSELLKGGLRAVTGLMGKANPRKIKYEAGTTIIGIRGTIFEMANIRRKYSSATIKAGVYIKVETGKVLVSSKNGSTYVHPNQTVAVFGDKAPQTVVSTKVFENIDEQIVKQKKLLKFAKQTQIQAPFVHPNKTVAAFGDKASQAFISTKVFENIDEQIVEQKKLLNKHEYSHP